MTDGWRLAIDLGSAVTAGAVAEDGTIADVTFTGRPVLPSAVALGANGQILTGWEALDWGQAHPHRVLPLPAREVAADAKVRLDGNTVLVADTVAAVLRRVRGEAAAGRPGRAPSGVIVCHPAAWTDVELSEIAAAVSIPGLAFMAGPVAAARHYLADCPAAGCAGSRVPGPAANELVICDFGAGLDVTVIRRDGDQLAIVGRPAIDYELGGDDLDERLMELLADRAYDVDPGLWDELSVFGPGLALVRGAVTRAREELSDWPHADIAVPGYGAAFRITRKEFVAAVKPELERMVALVETAITIAGFTPDGPPALALAGAVGRTPAVSDALAARFGALPRLATDPKAPVTHGALLGGLARGAGAAAGTTGSFGDRRHYQVFAPDDDDWLA